MIDLEDADVALLGGPEDEQVRGHGQESGEDRGRDEDRVEVEAERLAQPDGEVGPERERLGVGDVDEAGQPVDQREPDGRQDQRRLLDEADDDRLGDESPSAAARVPARRRPCSHQALDQAPPRRGSCREAAHVQELTGPSLASSLRTRWATRSAERQYMSSSSSSLADSV